MDLGFRDVEALDVILGPADGWGRVDTGAISRTGGSLSIDGGDGYDTVAIPNLRSGYSIVSDGDGGFIINDIDRSNGDTGWFEVRNFEAIAFADQTVEFDALLAASVNFGASAWSSTLLPDLGATVAFI